MKTIVGQKINVFEILADSGKRSKSGNILWVVKCQCCGKEKTMPFYSVVQNKSCGCLRTTLQRKGVWKGHGEIGGTYWHQLRSGAKVRNLPFDISIDDAWQLFLKQDRCCAITGEELKFSTKCDSWDGTASLDRIDSKRGYLKNNIQWVHKQINFMKVQLSMVEFIQWCEKVSLHNKIIKKRIKC